MTEIKRVVVPKASLPALNGQTEEYVVRYRIISEDRNRQSHWSAQYQLGLEPAYDITSPKPTTNIADVVGDSVLVSWVAQENTVYDVYAAWGFTNNTSVGLIYPDIVTEGVTQEEIDQQILDRNKYYYKSTSSNSVTFAIPSGALAVQILVQEVSYPKGVEVDSRFVAQSPVISLQ